MTRTDIEHDQGHDQGPEGEPGDGGERPVPMHGGSRFAGIAELLDEHHLAVVGDDPREREAFAQAIAHEVESFDGAEVLCVDGRGVHDIASFVSAFRQTLRARATSDEPADTAPSVPGLVRFLRSLDRTKRLYVIWRDADELLEADVPLFGRITNAFLGVAAEREHLSADLLVLQRLVLLGGDKLGAYAEEEHGQFQSWTLEDGRTPFPEVAEVVPQPPVITYRLDG